MQAVGELIRTSQEQRRDAVAHLSQRGSFAQFFPGSDGLSMWAATPGRCWLLTVHACGIEVPPLHPWVLDQSNSAVVR